METHDYPHASVKTARLSSADARYILEFVLKPLKESKHQDWHSYELHMIEADRGKRASLTSTEDHTLFLDKVIEPEVPASCDGLRKVAATGESYKFEPVDERDFLLDVAKEERGIRVKVQYDWAPPPGEFGWPVGVIVDQDNLLRFADDLESAFGEMIAESNARLLP
jgi:hypothetical protein